MNSRIENDETSNGVFDNYGKALAGGAADRIVIVLAQMSAPGERVVICCD